MGADSAPWVWIFFNSEHIVRSRTSSRCTPLRPRRIAATVVDENLKRFSVGARCSWTVWPGFLRQNLGSVWGTFHVLECFRTSITRVWTCDWVGCCPRVGAGAFTAQVSLNVDVDASTGLPVQVSVYDACIAEALTTFFPVQFNPVQ